MGKINVTITLTTTDELYPIEVRSMRQQARVVTAAAWVAANSG